MLCWISIKSVGLGSPLRLPLVLVPKPGGTPWARAMLHVFVCPLKHSTVVANCRQQCWCIPGELWAECYGGRGLPPGCSILSLPFLRMVVRESTLSFSGFIITYKFSTGNAPLFPAIHHHWPHRGVPVLINTWLSSQDKCQIISVLLQSDQPKCQAYRLAHLTPPRSFSDDIIIGIFLIPEFL